MRWVFALAAVLCAELLRAAVLCVALLRVEELRAVLLLAEEWLAVLRVVVLLVTVLCAVVVRFAAAEVRADDALLFAVLRVAVACVVRLAVVTFFFIYDGSWGPAL